jgi:hypothetical protein
MNEEWAVLTKALPSDLSGYAGGGVLVVDGPFEERDLGKQTVTLLFARSQAGQARIEKALRARKLGSIRSVRGVVTLWKRPPTPDEFSVIEGCV